MNLLSERERYLRQCRSGEFWKSDQRDEPPAKHHQPESWWPVIVLGLLIVGECVVMASGLMKIMEWLAR